MVYIPLLVACMFWLISYIALLNSCWGSLDNFCVLALAHEKSLSLSLCDILFSRYGLVLSFSVRLCDLSLRSASLPVSL